MIGDYLYLNGSMCPSMAIMYRGKKVLKSEECDDIIVYAKDFLKKINQKDEKGLLEIKNHKVTEIVIAEKGIEKISLKRIS